jgi:hypothetical protein
VKNTPTTTTVRAQQHALRTKCEVSVRLSILALIGSPATRYSRVSWRSVVAVEIGERIVGVGTAKE